MSFHDVNKDHFEKNTNIGVQYEKKENQKKIEKNWSKLKDKKELLLLGKIIVKDGEKVLSFWKVIRTLSFFLSVIFLIVIYFVFRYLSNDFDIIEKSFTNIFCPV